MIALAVHDAVTLQLKWVTQAQFAGYYVALENGYYAEENLDVTIRPGGPDKPAEAENISARIIMADGTRIALRANTASVALDADMATLSGDVSMASTSGFTVVTETLNTALRRVAGNTPGTVRGTGPLGEFTAGRMEFAAKTDGGPVHMVFKDGVKLIYDPKNR